MTSQDAQGGTLPTAALVVAVVLAGAAVLLATVRTPPAVLRALITALTEGGMAALIVIAAGGWAYPLVKRLAGGASTALCAVTAALGGLWMLSTAMLLVGSLTTGLLTGWVWWPVVAAGVALAAWQGRTRVEGWHWPAALDGRALVWVLVAMAVGLWIAGAMLPPGFISSFADDYDVLEYHLQLPRQYTLDQHVRTLDCNVYSHYPLGVEMLYLLCMCLRGGAYEGMYAAKMIHGAFGVLAAVAVFGALRRDADTRARFSAALLVTTPMAVYLSWMAMVELAQVAYLAVALLWLRQWLHSRQLGWAVALGAMMGGACAVKYLSVGFVLGPLAVVMLVYPIFARRPALWGHGAVALLAAALAFAPWLVRNGLAAGNPVFPLGSQLFGRPNFWPAECQQRWIDGHGVDFKPPVPTPAGYQMPPQPTPVEMFYGNFVLSQWFGPLSKVVAALAICVLIATTRGVDPWDGALAAVLVMQLGVWGAFTRGMPPRFAAPALVPMALLGGGMLAQLGAVQTNPFRRGAIRPSYGPWGMAPAIGGFFATVVINLLVCYGVYNQAGAPPVGDSPGNPPPPLHGVSGQDVATYGLPWRHAQQLPPSSRVLLVGDAKVFYFPANTAYATVFNAQKLDELIRAGLGAREIVARLRGEGITHLWFDWYEIQRLALTYGFPASLSSELLERARTGEAPSLPIIRELEAVGMTRAEEIELPPATAPASAPATAPSEPTTAPAPWPLVTIYALPAAPVEK
ncbi:MAG: glycosyltransferase family 39 protein [Phycisphaerae bacterium]|nr:glycosyltransferase family 39 protein [Phycisphaerae bacterium]